MISDRDGFRCIYARRLDPRTKEPLKEGLLVIRRFDNARLSPLYVNLATFKISVAADKLVLNIAEQRGNIWMAQLEEQ